MGITRDEVGSSFVFSSAPAFFVCMANNPVRDHHRDALNTSGRRCISAPLWTSKHGFEKRSFEKPLSAPLWTSKHGFEKRSFEKPLSAPYSFLNKAHFLVLIPAVLKTIAL